MLTLFFSGTGNTKYIAERFSKTMGYACHSIEDSIDFEDLICKSSRICVCYPIYGSRVPRIFKEFVREYSALFKNKEIIIIITQLIASGDGARVFVDLFPKKHFKVIYAEHINMPNNVCNFALLPLKNGVQNHKMIRKAEIRLARVCRDIQRGRIIRRGFNAFSRFLGLFQGVFEEKMNARGKNVKIDNDCTVCGLCVNACPMKNLRISDGEIKHDNNCTICYRCVNLCPQKAITTFFHRKPKDQYNGV
ncbi:MAG: EFR1 family ferrodoxin [Oscillospiraceae bacterium]|nr:EFR1 family ferrodoxin [Oscillospiraceae bacterium]